MILGRARAGLMCLVLSLFLPACASHPSASRKYDDADKGKGQSFPVPAEFQNGTATLAEAKAWYYSRCIGDGPVQSMETNLTPDGHPAVFVYDPSNEGTGGHNFMVFEKSTHGLKYVGDIDGGFRALPLDAAGNPRLVGYHHFGGTGNVITLYTLVNGRLVETAKRTVNDHEGDVDYQLISELFDSPTVCPNSIARAFPTIR